MSPIWISSEFSSAMVAVSFWRRALLDSRGNCNQKGFKRDSNLNNFGLNFSYKIRSFIWKNRLKGVSYLVQVEFHVPDVDGDVSCEFCCHIPEIKATRQIEFQPRKRPKR